MGMQKVESRYCSALGARVGSTQPLKGAAVWSIFMMHSLGTRTLETYLLDHERKVAAAMGGRQEVAY